MSYGAVLQVSLSPSLLLSLFLSLILYQKGNKKTGRREYGHNLWKQWIHFTGIKAVTEKLVKIKKNNNNSVLWLHQPQTECVRVTHSQQLLYWTE